MAAPRDVHTEKTQYANLVMFTLATPESLRVGLLCTSALTKRGQPIAIIVALGQPIAGRLVVSRWIPVSIFKLSDILRIYAGLTGEGVTPTLAMRCHTHAAI